MMDIYSEPIQQYLVSLKNELIQLFPEHKLDIQYLNMYSFIRMYIKSNKKFSQQDEQLINNTLSNWVVDDAKYASIKYNYTYKINNKFIETEVRKHGLKNLI